MVAFIKQTVVSKDKVTLLVSPHSLKSTFDSLNQIVLKPKQNT